MDIIFVNISVELDFSGIIVGIEIDGEIVFGNTEGILGSNEEGRSEGCIDDCGDLNIWRLVDGETESVFEAAVGENVG